MADPETPIAGAGAALVETPAARPARVTRALRHRDFRYFFLGNLTSNIGTWMQNVAQGWLVLELARHDSAFWLGVVGFASSVPMLVFSLIGGVIADRVNRRRLLITTQAAMMLFAFLLAVLTWTHLITIPVVALLAFATGLAMAITLPAYQAMQTELVPREDITNAIALNSAQFNLARVIGPTLGGFGIVWFGMSGNFLINGLSFFAVIVALVAIRYPAGAAADGDRHLWRDLVEGFRYVHRERLMRTLLTVTALVSLFALPYFVFVPWFARNVLHLDERRFGLLMAASGLGALLGATYMAYRHPRYRGRVVAGCAAALSLGIILFTSSRWFLVSAVLLGAIGFCMVMAIANVNALLQQLSSRAMRGRVMSIYTCAFLGLSPIGSLVAGSAAKWVGAPVAIGAMAAVALLGAVVVWFTQGELRALD
ncbi:MAG: MFS transporter [Terriglobales bacterium]